MGVDSRLFIPLEYSPKDISDLIKRLFKVEVKMEVPLLGYGTSDYITLEFKNPYYKEGDNTNPPMRCLHFHSNYVVGGFRGNLMSLKNGEHAKMILNDIANVTGGFFNEADYNSSYELYENNIPENTGFLLRQAQLDTGEAADVDVLVRYLQDHQGDKK